MNCNILFRLWANNLTPPLLTERSAITEVSSDRRRNEEEVEHPRLHSFITPPQKTMKKLLRLLFFILLIWVGFLYVIKNPDLPISQKILTTLWIDMTVNTGVDLTNCINYFDGCNTCMVSGGVIGGCTKMYCDTPAEPQCLEYANTGIDLTNCISYFDGCNNCSVKDGQPEACTLMYCETPGQPKCNEYATGTENTWSVGMANPASVNCEKNWWNLEIITQSDGGQIGMCHLADGNTCEERAYMRGECWTSTPPNGWTACTEEAKICSDGSAVGRTWPNCEFAPCPGDGWTACNMIYAPVCASVAIQCIKAPCNPVQQTFSNRCVMEQNKLTTFVHDGECGSANK